MDSSSFYGMDPYNIEGLSGACYSHPLTLQQPLDGDFYDYDVEYSHPLTLQQPLDRDFYDYDVEYSPAHTLEVPFHEGFYDYDFDCYSRQHTFEGPFDDFYYFDVNYYSRADTLGRQLHEDFYYCDVNYLHDIEEQDEDFEYYDAHSWRVHTLGRQLHEDFYYCDVNYLHDIEEQDEDFEYYDAHSWRAHSLECNTSTGSVQNNPNSNSVSTPLFTAAASDMSLGIVSGSARMDHTAATVLTHGVNSTGCKLEKVEESLNVRIEETREPIAIVNIAENSIKGGGTVESGN